MSKIAVIGAGSWGTTVAGLAVRSCETTLWAREPEVAKAIHQDHRNPRYLTEHELPADLVATADLGEAVEGASAVVMAVPSHGFRQVFSKAAPAIEPKVPILSLTKGIEQETLATMTQVVADVSPRHDPGFIGVLTGPNLASEVAAGQPTAAVVAFRVSSPAMMLQGVFMGPTFRVYSHDDVAGCELGGAIKNVMAIAAGMSDGLGFGDNTRAALITRALAELSRLGIALGGRPSTFAGLAGMGDLIATCISRRSRNHQVGFGMARGKSLTDITAEMDMVAEGIKTTRAVLDLAARHRIDMPIATHVGLVLHEGLHPREAVMRLMAREAKPED